METWLPVNSLKIKTIPQQFCVGNFRKRIPWLTLPYPELTLHAWCPPGAHQDHPTTPGTAAGSKLHGSKLHGLSPRTAVGASVPALENLCRCTVVAQRKTNGEVTGFKCPTKPP